MDTQLEFRRGETAAHARLKRLAALWAQAHGYSVCAPEVRVPRCRFRADIAAYGCDAMGERTAIFECKQSPADLRRDNCCTAADRARLQSITRRREIIERNLRIHFPALRRGEALFAEYDSYDFNTLNHSAHSRVSRQIAALHARVNVCTKFETLVRYRSANQFYLVVRRELYRDSCAPPGWGVLVESERGLQVQTAALWHENTPAARMDFLRRVAAAATRVVNQQLRIRFDDIAAERAASF